MVAIKKKIGRAYCHTFRTRKYICRIAPISRGSYNIKSVILNCLEKFVYRFKLQAIGCDVTVINIGSK